MSRERKARRAQRSSAPARSFLSIDSTDYKPLGLILLLAIAFRIIYLVSFQDSIFFGSYDLDSKVLSLWANDIAAGGASSQPFFRAPLYPYLVGFVYKFFGAGHMPIVLLQGLLGTLTALLTYFYARKLFDRPVATASGAVVACWPTLIFYEGELLITSTAVFLFFAAVVSMHLALERRSIAGLLTGGVVLGLAAITRPTILPVVLILPILAVVTRRDTPLKDWLRVGAIYAIGLAIPILPVTIRNYVIADDLVLISSQAGANFYIGNSRYADGQTVKMPMASMSSAGRYEDNIYTGSKQLAERRLNRTLKDSEVSAYWFDQTLGDIAADPGRSLRLAMKKLLLFWHGQEIFNNKSPYFAGDYSPVMAVLLWRAGLNFPSGLLFPLMLAGIVVAFERRRELAVPLLYLGILSVTVAAFFVCARFRQPVIPIAAIFAVVAIRSMITAVRQNDGAWRLPALVTLVCALALNLGGDIESAENKSQHHNIVGAAYLNHGQPDKALDHLHQALEIAPENRSAIMSLSYAYVQLGQLGQAEATLKRGIRFYPDSWQFNYNLGTLYYQANEAEAAKPYLWKAVEADSLQPNPYMGLASIYEAEQKVDSARQVYRILLQALPNFSPARQRLNLISP